MILTKAQLRKIIEEEVSNASEASTENEKEVRSETLKTEEEIDVLLAGFKKTMMEFLVRKENNSQAPATDGVDIEKEEKGL